MGTADFAQFVKGVIQQLEQNAARVQAAAASLCLTIDRWAPSSYVEEMRHGLAMEPVLLPRHKRRGTWYLENGEIIEYGKPDAHTVQTHKTTYLRRDYTMADVAMLQLARDAQARKIRYADAERWLEARRNGRVIPQKRVEAAPDPVDSTWRSRPARTLTVEQMVREQFTGRSLQRELRRIK